jgi:signal transduction histidine kinase
MQKILVVEDDAVQSTLISLLLEKHGYATVTAGNGQQALEVINNSRPDLVLSDINMPVMDGLALCTGIKSDSQLRALPVLLVTATENADDILRAMDAMADGYLTKPYDEEILVSTVTRLLAQREARSADSFEREEPVDLSVDGQVRSVTAGRRQAIDMLMFAYKNAAIQTQALAKSKNEMVELNKKLALTIAANKAKTVFLSGMSHELRTPLNAILGFGQLLDIPENPLNDDQRESVQHILDGGEHLLKLINDVLDLSKIESGQLSLSLEPINPYDAIRQCVDMTQNMCDAANITLVNKVKDSNDLWFIADLTRFKQTCLNLLSNAAKYNHDGGMITVRGERIENMVRISIEDTGPGIPLDRQHEIFTPFHRLGAEKEDIEGTGIGLTISKELIENMQGSIGFESKEGVGSSFWIELPVSENIAAQVQSDAKPRKITGALNDILAELQDEKTILYVEDNPINVVLMGRIINRSSNIKLITAGSAEEGLKQAEDIMPDLILMDINLPGMSGIEAKYVLAALPATKDIPVVAISANVMDDEISEAMKSGMLHYIKKPVDVIDTWKIIRDVFQNQMK